jgi:hypothetical protein
LIASQFEHSAKVAFVRVLNFEYMYNSFYVVRDLILRPSVA